MTEAESESKRQAFEDQEEQSLVQKHLFFSTSFRTLAFHQNTVENDEKGDILNEFLKIEVFDGSTGCKWQVNIECW